MGYMNALTRRINVRNRLAGYLFGGRHKSIVVQSLSKRTGPDDLGVLIVYVHLNSVRAGLVVAPEGRGLVDYPWSSLNWSYAVSLSNRLAWQWVEDGLGSKGLEEKGWKIPPRADAELEASPGSHRAKVLLAAALCSRTTLSEGWVAERLQTKSAANVSQQVRRAVKQPAFQEELNDLLSGFDG